MSKRLFWTTIFGELKCIIVPHTHVKPFFIPGVTFSEKPDNSTNFSKLTFVNIDSDFVMTPDETSNVLVPWHRNHEMMMCNINNPFCSRTALMKSINNMKNKHDITLEVGFEIEFVIKDFISTSKAVNDFSPTIYRNSIFTNMMDEIINALDDMGIKVLKHHAEAVSGQHEIVTTHGKPNISADNLLFTKEAISSVSSKYDLMIDFSPYPKLSLPVGNGNHMHFSLHKDGKNITIMDASQLDPITLDFVCGLVLALPYIIIFLAPGGKISCKRLNNGFAVGTFGNFSWGDKYAGVRVVAGVNPSHDGNIELKFMDSTANPYLAIAAVISAGMWGIQEHCGASLENGKGYTKKLTPQICSDLFYNMPPTLRKCIHENMGEILCENYASVYKQTYCR